MTPTEIITKDAEKRGLDPAQTVNSVAALIKKHSATLLHHGNTLLLLRGIGKNSVELHLFTEDSPLSLLKALKIFVKNIRQSKLDNVYGNADNDGIIQLLKKTGVDVLPSDLAQYNWMAKV
jgi:hypothetical protein